MTLLIIIIGIILGSFANVLIHRLPKGESIVLPRSCCAVCAVQLKWYQLIPIISYLFCLAKCKQCKNKIPIRYLIVEILVPCLFYLFFFLFGPSLFTLKLIVFSYFSIILFFTDIETKILPNELTYSLAIIGISFFIYEGIAIKGLIGFSTGFITFYLISIIGKKLYKQPVIGGGDIKLISAMGSYWGTQVCIITIYLSFIIGGVFAILLILFKKKNRKQEIAFGPSLIIASFISIFFTNTIWQILFPTL